MENEQTAQLLIIVLGIMSFILLALVAVWLYLKFRLNGKKSSNVKETKTEGRKSKIQESYSIQSIFDFMEFDGIEDNMIVQKKGKRFLMIVKCQGINYDLMSGVEKTAVEQGFIQYLNTLRYPIQIYIQTRKVDLGGSISTYKEKVKELGDNLAQKEYEYNLKVRSGKFDKNTLDAERFEIIKARNLYEYGIDIVGNTERMSLNKNILSKQYYVILAFYPDEANDSNYASEEVRNIAFSELYTRAQSTISLLSVSGVNGKILDSMELADLLYSAYNRDEAEIYDLKKALGAGFDNIYVTAPDILDKRMKELDKQIEIDAIAKANEAVYKVRYEHEKEKELKRKEKEYKDIVARMAASILEENENILGSEVVEKAKEKISGKEEKKNGEEATIKRPGRPRKTA